MNTVKESAYAKINLFLDVLSKTPDGFHEIRSVMHTVSLADEIVCSVAPAGKASVALTVAGTKFLPTDRKNLAVAAAWSFLDYTGIRAAVRLRLKKNIPIASGLAGGSADAAAVLRALNKLYRRPLTETVLCQLAAALGSDIPYCVRGRTALCEGRGERMTDIRTNLHLNAVIAVGDEHVSTPRAYETLDGVYAHFDGSVPTGAADRLDRLLAGLSRGELVAEGLFNAFEKAILPLCPTAAALREKLCELGASAALMSGSGPSVYGIFAEKHEAHASAAALRKIGVRAFAVETV